MGISLGLYLKINRSLYYLNKNSVRKILLKNRWYVSLKF